MERYDTDGQPGQRETERAKELQEEDQHQERKG